MSDAPQNPYSKSVRNLKKKLADIIALEEKSASGATLTPEQQAKLATQGKVAAEFAEMEQKHAEWDASHAHVLAAPAPAPAASEKKKKSKPKPEAAPTPEPEAKSAPAEKAPKKKEKAVEKAAPEPQEQPMEIDDSANPYKKQVRNLRKKMDDILALEQKVNSGAVDPNAEQKKKLQTKSQVAKELKSMEVNAAEWNAEQLRILAEICPPQPAAQSSPAKPKPKPKAEKQPKAQEAPKAEKAPKEDEAPQAANGKAPKAEKPPKAEKAPKQEKAPKAEKAPKVEKAPKAEKAPEPVVEKPTIDLTAEVPDSVKPYRNKVRNIQKKLTEIQGLKARPASDLTAEQVEKVKGENQLKRDLESAEALFIKMLGAL
jgi:hypothetical protein|eukprot:CAMPEP_0174301210 /NCGR_PEP_ID=MMETSP0809-20121228/58911_1 /TAXON_ID=73025 ORGANISM="Eutreptiella gymnastica-like, Strain CCMP1594" /NCGR_SAMPLE_ID=MMETSP0809 /ASSEMBLY_ACC=CAM_ASM_000658 /LENGTH=371 /DNA_ID=CAMNT_0015406915 /DNA_START=33 /DNA_END=1148 /DNA_ORIENTATION=+